MATGSGEVCLSDEIRTLHIFIQTYSCIVYCVSFVVTLMLHALVTNHVPHIFNFSMYKVFMKNEMFVQLSHACLMIRCCSFYLMAVVSVILWQCWHETNTTQIAAL
jgi:hypothetical protein